MTTKKSCKLYTALTTLFGTMIFLICIEQGCSMEEKNDFNALLFDNAGKWINLDFQKENLTQGVWGGLYFNGEYIETDETYPMEKIFIIDNQTEFDTIFNVFPPGVNFEKDIILLWVFTNITMRPVVIERVKLENERLNIGLKYVRLAPPGKPNEPNATVPQMRWFVIKMEKLDIDTVEFSLSS